MARVPTVKQAGRRGGKRTLALYGANHFRDMALRRHRKKALESFMPRALEIAERGNPEGTKERE